MEIIDKSGHQAVIPNQEYPPDEKSRIIFEQLLTEAAAAGLYVHEIDSTDEYLRSFALSRSRITPRHLPSCLSLFSYSMLTTIKSRSTRRPSTIEEHHQRYQIRLQESLDTLRASCKADERRKNAYAAKIEAAKEKGKAEKWPRLVGGTAKQKELAEVVRFELDQVVNCNDCKSARDKLKKSSEWLNFYEALKVSKQHANDLLARTLHALQ